MMTTPTLSLTSAVARGQDAGTLKTSAFGADSTGFSGALQDAMPQSDQPGSGNTPAPDVAATGKDLPQQNGSTDGANANATDSAGDSGTPGDSTTNAADSATSNGGRPTDAKSDTADDNSSASATDASGGANADGSQTNPSSQAAGESIANANGLVTLPPASATPTAPVAPAAPLPEATTAAMPATETTGTSSATTNTGQPAPNAASGVPQDMQVPLRFVGSGQTASTSADDTQTVPLSFNSGGVDLLANAMTKAGADFPDATLMMLVWRRGAQVQSGTPDQRPTADALLAPVASPSAAGTPAPAPTVAPTVVSVGSPLAQTDMAQGVGQHIQWMVGQRLQGAEIRLNPAHLGPMEVRLQMHNDQASIQFLSPHQAVRDALEAALPRLRDMLGSQGVDLLNVDISDQSLANNQPGYDDSGATATQPPFASTSGELTDNVDQQSWSTPLIPTSMLDLFV